MLGQKEVLSSYSQLERRMPVVARGLDQFFAVQSQKFAERNASSELLTDWAKRFTEKFLLVRANRANDLQKPGVKEAQRLVRDFFGPDNFNYIVDCMDGRNMPAVETSHPPHEGGIMRTAGGDFETFRDGLVAGTVVVDTDSFKAQAITRLLLTKARHNIHYSFNSHFGCAARGGAEQVAGSIGKDSGLAKDIERKIALAYGVLQIRDQLLAQGEDVADIFPEFYSYDPHDGSMTMGLEMYVYSLGADGYAPEILSALQEEGKIVSTWQFLHDADIAHALKKVVKPADLRFKYAESMGANWRAITALYDGGNGPVFQKIEQALVDAYTQGGWTVGEEFNLDTANISYTVLRNKAQILLKNLVTRWSIAGDKHEWPYDKHQEQVIVFTEGGYAPFEDIDGFSIFSRGEVLNHAYLAAGLVRNFRRVGAITDPVEMLSGDDFVQAPVMIMNKAILRDMSDAGWKALEGVDLGNIIGELDWDDQETLRVWDRSNIVTQVISGFKKDSDILLKPQDLAIFIDGVYEVFQRMQMLMSDPRFRSLMIKGQIMAVNLLVDRDRLARMVIPFTV